MNELLAAHLPVLAAVADAGGVTAAARALGLSQPAVSNRLRTLEGVAGGQVVRRAGRGVVLTELGERLLPHARAVARASARAGVAITAPRESELAARVALSEAAVPLVMPVLAACAAGEPPLRLSVIGRDGAAAVGAVVAGEADLAVAVSSPERPADDLERRPVLLDEIVLVRAGAQPAAAPLEAVRPLVVLWQAAGSGVRTTVERVLEEHGVWPRDSLELESSIGVLAAAAAGRGAAFLPRSFAEPWAAAGRVSLTSLAGGALSARFDVIAPAAAHLATGPRRVYDALLSPGSGPVATGRDGSEHHSDHEPG